MPHTLIETAEHAVASVELPNNGEADGIESIEAAFQELLNRSGLAIAGIAGLMLAPTSSPSSRAAARARSPSPWAA